MHSETDINGVKKNPIKIIKLHLLFCKDVNFVKNLIKWLTIFGCTIMSTQGDSSMSEMGGFYLKDCNYF